MKKLYLTVILNAIIICSNAQSFNWAKRGGLWAYDYGYGVGTDNAGNVYVAGKYEEAAIFDGNVLPCNNCNHDIFVARYSPTGTIDWIHTGGGHLGDYAHALSTDGNYVYVAGEIEGWSTDTISFPGTTFTLSSHGDNDPFLAKYDLNGNLLWVKNEGWWHTDKWQAVTYDNAGNIYAAGYFKDTTKVNATLYPGHGGSDAVIIKYDPSGNVVWTRTAGSPGRDEAKGVVCDAAGNVYMCGFFSDSAVFAGQVYHSPNGYFDMYIAKYDPNGTLQWVSTAGGNYDEVAWGITIDNAGLLYVTGEFNASAMFGTTQLITSGNADVFVACYDQSGNVLWAKKAGGPLIDRARGIGTDGSNIVITGQFGSTANFGSYTVTAPDSSDIFFASLDNAGNYIGALSATGIADTVETLGYESGNGICADAFGNVYATGSMLDGAVFGSTTLQEYRRTDFYLTRISQLTGVKQNQGGPQVFSIFPNPANGRVNITCNTKLTEEAAIILRDAIGRDLIKQKINSFETAHLDLSGLPAGVYLLDISQADGSSVRNKLVVTK